MVVCKFFLQGSCKFGSKSARPQPILARRRILTRWQTLVEMNIPVLEDLGVEIVSELWLTPVVRTMVSCASFLFKTLRNDNTSPASTYWLLLSCMTPIHLSETYHPECHGLPLAEEDVGERGRPSGQAAERGTRTSSRSALSSPPPDALPPLCVC
jgi:hypothetical protein